MKNEDLTYFAVGNIAEHTGHVTSRRDAEAWPVEGGWTYQGVTGAHGTVLYEGESEREAERVLAAWLACAAPETGAYCYAHNRDGR